MSTTNPRRSEGVEVFSIALTGLEPTLIKVSATVQRGSGTFHLEGLPEASMREARVRVRSALQQVGVDLDERDVTVRLEPAITHNGNGGVFDLAIAVAILGALGKVPAMVLDGLVLLGELSLNGYIRPVRGVLPMLRAAMAFGLSRAIVPRSNTAEAAALADMHVRVADQLSAVRDHLLGTQELEEAGTPFSVAKQKHVEDVDLADIRGLVSAKRALEIAAAGGHSILLIGPPASGRTMLARRLPTLLPTMSLDEMYDVTAIYSIAGLLQADQGLMVRRPFRAPHHTISAVGLVGGGDPVRPGEVSLTHGGVLLLDEPLEFRRDGFEVLGRALADGQAFISRRQMRTSFPARPHVVIAAHPCPCGFHGDLKRKCSCPPERIRSYRQRMRGPVFDRIDMQAYVPPVDAAELHGKARGESSETVRMRVTEVRAKQLARCEKMQASEPLNTCLSEGDLERLPLDEAGRRLLTQAAERRGFSVAVQHKVLRLARTIADMEGTSNVRAPHVAEAVHLAPTFSMG
jgi:magnesium chelatase family protein